MAKKKDPFYQWYHMKLGESFMLTEYCKIWRVPGGWLCQSQVNVCFIPMSDEFVCKL